jgi:hypothetical protein
VERQRQKRRDITFPLVLAMLLLFPFCVDQMFVQLRFVMRSGGFFAMSDLEPRQKPLKNQHCRGAVRGGKGYDPAWPFCGATVAAFDESNAGASPNYSANQGGSLEALAAAERAEWEIINGRQQGKMMRNKAGHWTDIAPMPSNPSRFFPEPRHPMLASGVPLTTGRPDPHWEDPLPPPPARVVTKAQEEQPPPRTIASIATPAPSPMIASPVRREPPKPELPDWPETPRLEFHAKTPSAKPSTERLLEVCGRMVPESQAASASAACAAKAAKPKDMDEGGNDTLLMP